MLKLEAIITNPVYEGKSIDGLIKMCENGDIPKGSKILYTHLGGVPAVQAYHKVFEDVSTIKTLGKEAKALH